MSVLARPLCHGVETTASARRVEEQGIAIYTRAGRTCLVNKAYRGHGSKPHVYDYERRVLASNYNLAATGSSHTAVALSIELCYKRVCPGISVEAAALRLPRTTGCLRRSRLLSLLSLPGSRSIQVAFARMPSDWRISLIRRHQLDFVVCTNHRHDGCTPSMRFDTETLPERMMQRPTEVNRAPSAIR